MSKYLNKLLKTSGNLDATVVANGIKGADVAGHVDTGSYTLNALLSGSIYGGIPDNKITAFAGEPSTGKTFLALSIVAKFLETNKNGIVIYFDTEQAVTKQMFVEREMDVTRIGVIPVSTVEELKTQALKIVNDALVTDESEREPIFMVLDSLGNLSTTKEMNDSLEGKEAVDMTRAKALKSAFRTLTLMMGKARIPFLVTNHVYDALSLYSPKIMSGGSALKFCASTIVFLSKSKDKGKDDKTVVGSITKCTAMKNRFVKEYTTVETCINYTTGLVKYYGLTSIALEAGVFTKDGNKIQVNATDKVFESKIDAEPEKYFTKEVLDKIDLYVQQNFKYGQPIQEETEV